jgi:2-polyprenyl-3-methyl-5-hydroxy-6-metoxy-1,4-benzoquinol methylase
MTAVPDKANRIEALWSAADYHRIAVRDAYVSELLVRAVDIHPGERVLDVAAGSGNTAIAAARRGADVTATDIVSSALETAMRRAAVDGLDLWTETADAEHLPFPDQSFQAVLSTFGVIYAPDHQRTADELVRVCRHGGRIGMANWTPTGLVGKLHALMTDAVTAPPVAARSSCGPATLWGTERHCRELFGNRVDLTMTVRVHELCALTGETQVELLLKYMPPWRSAYDAMPPGQQRAVFDAAVAEFDRVNRALDGTSIAAAEYLEVVATVK